MNANREIFPLQPFHRGEHIVSGMAPSGMYKDFLHEGLSAKFHSIDSMMAKKVQKVFIDLIRPCGNPETVDQSFSNERMGHLKKPSLLFSRHPRKSSAVESNLNRTIPRFPVS